MTAPSSPRVRPAAVAGMFYPANRDELAGSLGAMLTDAGDTARGAALPKAIIAPHAGYVYSGPVAASVYGPLRPAHAAITRVVLLGPAHRVAVRGLALPGVDAFSTPLGVVEIDSDGAAAISVLPQVVTSAAAHGFEHSLEVHVPFLQTVFDRFALLPLAVGYADAYEVAEVLEKVWGGPETLIVVSSDLSHYHDYRTAQRIDRATADAILGLDTEISHDEACGATPIVGLNLAARRRGLKPQLVDLRNSGDTAGDKTRVVGYGAFAYLESGAHASS